MTIELHEILIKDLVDGYGGKLNIRPKYQREFVYKDKQRDAVIESILKNHHKWKKERKKQVKRA